MMLEVLLALTLTRAENVTVTVIKPTACVATVRSNLKILGDMKFKPRSQNALYNVSSAWVNVNDAIANMRPYAHADSTSGVAIVNELKAAQRSLEAFLGAKIVSELAKQTRPCVESTAENKLVAANFAVLAAKFALDIPEITRALDSLPVKNLNAAFARIQKMQRAGRRH